MLHHQTPDPSKPGYNRAGQPIGMSKWGEKSKPVSRKAAKFNTILYMLISVGIIWGVYESNKTQFSGNRSEPSVITQKDIELSIKRAEERKSKYPDYSKNQFLIALEGKKIDDWAVGLQEYATVGRKYDAQFYRDLADSTEIYSSFKGQDRTLRIIWGRDANGNARCTRAHVREVKEKYSK